MTKQLHLLYVLCTRSFNQARAEDDKRANRIIRVGLEECTERGMKLQLVCIKDLMYKEFAKCFPA